MRVLMLGTGALGGLFAHHLLLGGAEVCALDIWQEHVEAISRDGLRLQVDGLEVVSPLKRATTSPRDAGIADLVVLFVKGYDSREALASVRPAVAPHTAFVTLQNGLGNPQLVREMFPANPVLFGLTTLTSDVLGPGRIEPRSTASGVTDVWALDAGDTAPLQSFVALLNRGGISARVNPQIELSVWKKLVVNCALNGLCAVTDLNCGQMDDEEAMRQVLDGIADEVSLLARSKGIALDAALARSFLKEVTEASLEHYPSMVYDVRRRRRTEIENMNGAIVRESEQRGLAAPFNRVVYGLVRAVEGSYASTRARHPAEFG